MVLIRRIVMIVILFLVTAVATAVETGENGVTLHYFWGEGCPHCAKAKPFVAELAKRHPRLQVRDYEVFENEANLELLMGMARRLGEEATGVPTFFIGGEMFSGFSPETARQLEERVSQCLPAAGSGNSRGSSVDIPFFGRVDTASLSLPVFTVVVAGLDSFNPCAFFVLLFLLSLMTHVHSRPRMLLIGGIFVLFSGLIYFLFMAAWLNLFMLVGHLPAITVGAGLLAVGIAAINIKEFFLFRQGVSLTIPEQAKPRLFERMREIVRLGTLPAMAAATMVLSVAANSYELLCTAGFPMVFTRVLTLHQLPTVAYYGYLAFYNLVYVVPLALIVAVFAATLGSRKLSEWQGRVLKLVSGSMMLGLGSVLLVRPALLDSALVSFAILLAALLVAWLAIVISRLVRPERFSAG